MTTPTRTLALALAAALGLAQAAALAAGSDTTPADAADLSLEELLAVDVQTASRKPQRLQDVAAAVFVITREDIERSGATTLPEALRLAPGVQVARLANNRWAVTARGFNGRFANKLLVLMDGRSIYSPLFSGVIWETEDTLLEDIDRIEVIRGPGASLWGANAVNGVINILTRKARDTVGTLVVASTGSEDRGLLAVRHGLPAGDGNLRVWGKAFDRDPAVTADGTRSNDNWREVRGGFRGDWTIDTSRRLSLSGGAYRHHSGDTWLQADVASPQGRTATAMDQVGKGVHLLARHEWTGADASETALQGYVERSDLEIAGAFHQWRDTVDLDFQNRPRLGANHDLIWGLGYRSTSDHVDAQSILAVSPERTRNHLLSAFVQDEITIAPEQLRAVLGIRMERNSYTGFEPQPNLRLTWTPTAQQTVWGAWSRAVRTPSRAERTASVDLQVTPGAGPVPTVLTRSVPDPARPFGNEVVRSLELGFRQQFDTRLSFDVAAFDNRYTHLRGGTLGGLTPVAAPVPYLVQEVSSSNGVAAHTRGLELAIDWHVTPTWRLQPVWSTIRIEAHGTSGDPIDDRAAAAYAGNSPRHQLSLRSSTTLADRTQLDAWLRHVSALSDGFAGTAIPAYTTLDLRCAWRLRAGLELSVTGQNLLDPQHPELTPELLPSQPLELQRAVVVKARWQF